nr:hypothetical protein [Salinisphaera sp. LB1]
MVEAEHAGEKRAVRAGKPAFQIGLQPGRGFAGGVEQGVLAAFLADRLDLGLARFEARADAQRAVGMYEVQRRLGGKAEQKIADRAAGGGFAGLVGAEHDMQIGGPRCEGHAPIGEMAIGQQSELGESHEGVSPAARRASR